MKNIKTIIGLIICLIVLGLVGYMETHHTQTGYIIGIDQKSNDVLIKDNTDNLWIINDKGFNIGDNVKITFNNQATTTKEDDIITNIKKI